MMFITEIFLFESDTKENCSEDFSQTSSLRSLSPLLEIRTEVKRKTKRDGSVMMVVVKWRGVGFKMSPFTLDQNKNVTFANLDHTHDNDEAQGQELPCSEDILNTSGPSHTVAVHPRQQH